MFEIKFNSFFDRKAVTDAIDRAEISVLNRMGALVRLTMQRSMRRRKKSSAPGEPPSSHVGLLRDLIFYFYDSSTRSVVAGPALARNRSGKPVPQLLDEGGTSSDGKTYDAFPFKGPALSANVDKFPDLFANSVKG